MIVWPSRLSLRMKPHRLCRSSTSTPAVGSSSTMAGGLVPGAWPARARRLMHERLADEHAPLHAAGERAHVGVGLGREVEMMQDFIDPFALIAQSEIAPLD